MRNVGRCSGYCFLLFSAARTKGTGEWTVRPPSGVGEQNAQGIINHVVGVSVSAFNLGKWQVTAVVSRSKKVWLYYLHLSLPTVCNANFVGYIQIIQGLGSPSQSLCYILHT
jgi:hypothetical protein